MMRPPKQAPATSAFDLWSFLDGTAIPKQLVVFPSQTVIFAQGDPSVSVMCIQHGSVVLSVRSHVGEDAIVAMLGPGDFLGEAAVVPGMARSNTATAHSRTTALAVSGEDMRQLVHSHAADFGRYVLERMIARNIRIEEALIDQLFHSCEQRLARTLLLLAQKNKEGRSQAIVPNVSQQMLADMIGTSRSRVNFFMTRFRAQGLISYHGHSSTRRGVGIQSSLLRRVIHEKPATRRKR